MPHAAPIGDALRSARVSKAMSLSAVASKAGISVATLSRIETNKQNVDVALLLELTRILGITPSSVLGGNGEDHGRDALVRELASVTPHERALVFADAAKRTRRSIGRDDQIGARLDSLLTTLDVMREELLEIRRTVKRRK